MKIIKSRKYAQIIPNDGIADGGEPYTDDEMDFMEVERDHHGRAIGSDRDELFSLDKPVAKEWFIRKIFNELKYATDQQLVQILGILNIDKDEGDLRHKDYLGQ